MLACRIYSEDWDVDSRLQAFGVTRAELIEVVRGVVGARADATDDDPVSAEGLFAYIYGTRYLRGLFRPKKWIRQRQENIESVRHPEKNLRIIYQSVDVAASRFQDPRAISGKGSGADRIIDSAQGSLFTEEQLADAKAAKVAPIDSGVWFFCVSVDGDNICAELSLPSSIDGKNFNGFLERIFVVREGEWTALSPRDEIEGDAVEFEPIVTRK